MADYNALAEGVEELREMMRAIVAGLMTDGYTEDQARELAIAVAIKGMK